MRLYDAGLVEALHEGMFQTPLWGDFLERLVPRAGALSVWLMFRPIDNDKSVVELRAGLKTPPHMPQLFLEKYGKNPIPYREMRENRVYSLDELLDRNNPVQLAFYEDFMEPQGLTNLRAVRVREPTGVDAWLGCAGGKNLDAGVSALLSSLAPHLRVALRAFIALEREKFRSSVSSETFGRLDVGWLTLDARGRIADMTGHIEQLFQRTTALRRGRYNRLTPASPAIDRELTALVKHFAEHGEGQPKAINVSRDPWIDMLVAPVQNRSVSGGATPVAIVYVSGDRRSRADRQQQLVDLFGLLPSEARFAWVLAQGVSIKDAASAVGITEETARNYSKKIYAKTGARGHAELVRIILTSVLTMT